MTTHDTQFAGFAKLLVTEIINQVPSAIYPLEIDISDKLEKLLAQRASDFAKHIVSIMPYLVHNSNIKSLNACLEYIPDMTEWPPNEEQES